MGFMELCYIVKGSAVMTKSSRKGITPILATLLLIVIAVGAVVITYAWMTTYMGSTTKQAGAMLRFDAVTIDAEEDDVMIYVRNKGTGSVVVDKVFIDNKDFTTCTNLTSPTTILSGDVLLIKATNTTTTFDFQVETTYKVKVSGPETFWEEPCVVS